MENSPTNYYTLGYTIEGRITKLMPNKIWLSIDDGPSAFIPNYELPGGVVDRAKYHEGDVLKFIVKHQGTTVYGAIINQDDVLAKTDLYVGQVLDATVVKHLDFGVVASLKSVLPFTTILLPYSQCSKAVGSKSARQMLQSFLPVFSQIRLVLTHILPDGKLKGSLIPETFRYLGADETKMSIKRPTECETFEAKQPEVTAPTVKKEPLKLLPVVDSALFRRNMDDFEMPEYSSDIDFDAIEERVQTHFQPAAQRNMPKSYQEYELLIAQQPESSFIYLQYAAFHLERANLDAAFKVIERGLQQIPQITPQGLQEHTNLLVARAQIQLYFYGEHIFNQKLRETFAALADPGKFCHYLVTALEGQPSVQETVFAIFFNNKQRRTDFECQKLRLQFLYRNGKEQQARESIPAILQQVNLAEGQSTRYFLSFVARLEYQSGHVAEGRAAYEKLIESSKIDILLHYIDCEEKHGDIEYLRALFKRFVEKDYGARKNKTMSVILKRWLEIEKRQGSQQRIAEIRALAAQMLY